MAQPKRSLTEAVANALVSLGAPEKSRETPAGGQKITSKVLSTNEFLEAMDKSADSLKSELANPP